MAIKPDNWAEMTPEEKRTWRLENFRNSGKNIEFTSPQAEENYNRRVNRLIDVYNVQVPDRVPLSIRGGILPLTMEGVTGQAIYYEPDKACQASVKFNEKYADQIETYLMPVETSGEVMDILGYKLYAWPGGGLPKTSGNWQFVEGEYMTVDEYDDLIRDPSDFWLRKYLPRVMQSFAPFGNFQPFTSIIENLHVNNLSPFSMPAVKEMFTTFIKAGEAFERYQAAVKPYLGMGPAHGFPIPGQIYCFAPFDILGDTLRGTTNIMKDMFRRPQNLLAALDVITEAIIHNTLNHPAIDNTTIAFYPLHKGADGWMSQTQFEKFYWPSLKKVMDAFIKEGLIQTLFAEGSFNSRLNYVNQFPRGSVTWLFDQSDMVKAKEALGKDCCISGNVPTSLIVTGTPKQVKDYCRNLIETAGKDGGYILAPGANAENPKLENLIAMAEAVNEYGYYK